MTPYEEDILGRILHFSNEFEDENGPPTEVPLEEFLRACARYQPPESNLVRDYSKATFKADPTNDDASLGIGTSGNSISNAPEESGQVSNAQRCLWVDKLAGKICGNSVPPELRALLDHLSKNHDVRGEEKRKLECRWALDSGGVCGKTFQRRNVKRHMEAHLNLRVFCDHCPKDFARTDTLKEHVRDEHQANMGGPI